VAVLPRPSGIFISQSSPGIGLYKPIQKWS
jgi:hypothetical protein